MADFDIEDMCFRMRSEQTQSRKLRTFIFARISGSRSAFNWWHYAAIIAFPTAMLPCTAAAASSAYRLDAQNMPVGGRPIFPNILISTTNGIGTADSAESVALNEQAGTSQVSLDQSAGQAEKMPPSEDNADANPEKLLDILRDGRPPSPTAKSFDRFDAALGNGQIFSDLRSLQNDITESQRPVTNLIGRYASQSDNVSIIHVDASQDIFLSQGRDQLRLGVQALEYRPDNGLGVSELIAGLAGKHRFNDLATITGDFWLNRIKSGSQDNIVVTYDVFLTLRPTDYVRIDLDTNRRTFDNIRSLQMGITAQTFGGSIDFMPTDTVRLTVRGAGGFFSDRNRRQSAEAEGIWRIKGKPVIEVGARSTYFHFSRLLNNGYFNPEHYASGEAMFRIQSALSKKLQAELSASGGIEYADPGGYKPIIKTSLQMTYKVAKSWTLDGGLSYFSSRNSNTSGFARTSFSLGLHYKF